MRLPVAFFLLLCVSRLATPQAPTSFEVASVRLSPANHGFFTISPPGSADFHVTSASMLFLLSMAYDVGFNQTLNAPSWADSTLYDITAKVDRDTGLSYPQLQPFLQTLLHERFHLQAHMEQREVSGYALVVAKGGPKLQRPTGPAPDASSTTASIYSEGLRGASIPLKTLAGMLRSPVGSPVVDATGLAGNYDITLRFANPQSTNDAASDPTQPSIFTALTEQLGLRLRPQKVALDFLVIDHVDKLPTDN